MASTHLPTSNLKCESLLFCFIKPCHDNVGKFDESKDESVTLLPKLKSRIADTPGNIAEMLSKELARVWSCHCLIIFTGAIVNLPLRKCSFFLLCRTVELSSLVFLFFLQ